MSAASVPGSTAADPGDGGGAVQRKKLGQINQHSDDQAEEHLLSPLPTSAPGESQGAAGSSAQPDSRAAIDRIDQLIAGTIPNTTPIPAPRTVSLEKHRALEKELAELRKKAETAKKKSDEEIADLEKFLQEVEDEKEKVEKRLKFEKESSEFQFKMEQKAWQKEKKTLSAKITELESRLGKFDSKRLGHKSPQVPKKQSKQVQETDENESEAFVQRMFPLTIPESTVSLELPNASPVVPRSAGSRRGSVESTGGGGRIQRADSERDWGKEDLENHCSHLQAELKRSENDAEMYKAQVEELNFKVEQLDENLINQKKANDLIEKEREQLQQRFVKSLRERSEQDAAFRAERQQWNSEKEKLMLKLEEFQTSKTAAIKKVEEELRETTAKLRSSENERSKTLFELEKLRREAQDPETKSQTSIGSQVGEDAHERSEAEKSKDEIRRLERQYLETQSTVSQLQTELDEVKKSRDDLKHQLNKKETEILCWRDWKDSEAVKSFKEKEATFIREKDSIIHELTECQVQIAFLKNKLEEQASTGDLAGKFHEWMYEVNRLHERYRSREGDDKALLNQTKQELASKTAEWAAKEKELNAQMEQMSREHKDLHAQLQQKVDSLASENKKNQSRLKETETELSVRTAECSRLMKQIEDQRQEMVEMRMYEESLSRQINNKEKSAESTIASLKEKIDSFMENAKKNFNAIKLQNEAQVSMLRHQITQLSVEKQEMSRQLDTEKAVVQEAQRSIEENKARMMALQRENRNREDTIATLNQQLNKMEFELQRKQQESLQINQKLMAEQRKVVDVFNKHNNALKMYQRQVRKSKPLEFWEDERNYGTSSSGDESSSGTALDIVKEYKIVNEELMVSMEKCQNARKGEVEVLEQEIQALKDEKVKQRQSLMTRVNELEGQLRNVDLVQDQLRSALEECSRQQRSWLKEKQDLMNKNAELDLTKFSDRAKIYELQIEVSKLQKLVETSECGSKMSTQELYQSDKEDASSSSVVNFPKIEEEVDQQFAAFLQMTHCRKPSPGQGGAGGGMLVRTESKRLKMLQKSKSLDTDSEPPPTVISVSMAPLPAEDQPASPSSSSTNTQQPHHYQQSPVKESALTRYQKRKKATKNQLSYARPKPAGRLVAQSDEEHDTAAERSDPDSTLDRRSGSTSAGSSGGSSASRRKNQIFTFLKEMSGSGSSSSGGTLGRQKQKPTELSIGRNKSQSVEDNLQSAGPSAPPTPAGGEPQTPGSLASNTSVFEPAGSEAETQSIDSRDTRRESAEPECPSARPETPSKEKSSRSRLGRFTKMIRSRSRSRSSERRDQQLRTHLPDPAEKTASERGSSSTLPSPSPQSDQESLDNAEKKWFFTWGRKKGRKFTTPSKRKDSGPDRMGGSNPEIAPEIATSQTCDFSACNLNDNEELAEAARIVTEELGALINADLDAVSTSKSTSDSEQLSLRGVPSKPTEPPPPPEKTRHWALDRAKRALSPRRSRINNPDEVKLRPRASSPMPRPLSSSSQKYVPPPTNL